MQYIRTAGRFYNRLLKAHPFKVQMATSGALFGLGDYAAQRLEYVHAKTKAEEASQKAQDKEVASASSEVAPFHINWNRSIPMMLTDVMVITPIGHLWYLHLDGFVGKFFTPMSRKFILVKVLSDSLLFAPVMITSLFTVASLAEGKTIQETKAHLSRNFLPAWGVDLCVWPLAQAINFSFVPLSHQLVYVNGLSFFWDIFLSHVQHHGLQIPFLSPKPAPSTVTPLSPPSSIAPLPSPSALEAIDVKT